MSSGHDSGAAKRREVVRRYLVALVHHRDQDVVNVELARAADWLAEHEPGELQTVMAPAPRFAPRRYLVTWFADGGWRTQGDGHEHTHPSSAWRAFRGAPAGAELIAVGLGVTRRVAVRRSRREVRFIEIDELALEGRDARDALDAWQSFAGPPPAARAEPPPVAEAAAASPIAPRRPSRLRIGAPPAAAAVEPSYVEIIPAAVTLPPPDAESPPVEGASNI